MCTERYNKIISNKPSYIGTYYHTAYTELLQFILDKTDKIIKITTI